MSPRSNHRPTSQTRTHVARALRRLRIERDLTQAQLGALAGVKQQSIAKLEDPRNNPSVKTLARVCEALGVDFSISFVRRTAIAPVNDQGKP